MRHATGIGDPFCQTASHLRARNGFAGWNEFEAAATDRRIGKASRPNLHFTSSLIPKVSIGGIPAGTALTPYLFVVPKLAHKPAGWPPVLVALLPVRCDRVRSFLFHHSDYRAA